MQQPANPYRTPAAPVADGPEQYGEVKILSSAGRLGRVRYIGYSIGLTLLFYLAIAIGAGIGAAMEMQGIIIAVAAAAVIGMLIVTVLLTIQRCHDFNMSGWLSLLLIVPLAPLLFWIIPGTQGRNRFGYPPPPNTTGAVVLALILPIIFALGIVAAIAVPSYMRYVERAKMVEQPKQQEPVEEAASAEEEQAQEEKALAGEGQDSASTATKEGGGTGN